MNRITLIVNAVGTVLILSFAIYLYIKTSQARKRALIVLPVRLTIKLLMAIGFLLIFIIDLPYTWYFLGYMIAVVLGFFSADIIVENAGIYFPLHLTPWEEIEEISNNLFCFIIRARKVSDRKYFLKIIWKITDSDIARLEALFTEKRQGRV